MSDSGRVTGDRVFCHVCKHEWNRSEGGLQCPQCESEFVEILEPGTRDEVTSPPPIPNSTRPTHSPDPFYDHNPWADAPDPDEGDIDDVHTWQSSNGRNRGTIHFTTRTFTFGGNNSRGYTFTSHGGDLDPSQVEIGRNFESMLGTILGFGGQRRQPGIFGGTVRSSFEFPPSQNRGFGGLNSQPPDLSSFLFRNPHGENQSEQPANPFDFLSALLGGAMGRHGDAVFSQEAFDRVMSQLMEQNQGTGAPGPASEEAINNLQKKAVDEDMLGPEKKAECSICMDNVELGQEVTVLPCGHWFHGECVVSWLKEHDTCPHCRQPISAPEATTRRPQSSRRRSSRRSSSMSSPLGPSNLPPIAEPSDRYSPQVSDTPSGLREARARYYGRPSTSEAEQSQQRRRRSSTRGDRSAENNDSQTGGFGGWVRSRLSFQ